MHSSKEDIFPTVVVAQLVNTISKNTDPIFTTNSMLLTLPPEFIYKFPNILTRIEEMLGKVDLIAGPHEIMLGIMHSKIRVTVYVIGKKTASYRECQHCRCSVENFHFIIRKYVPDAR